MKQEREGGTSYIEMIRSVYERVLQVVLLQSIVLPAFCFSSRGQVASPERGARNSSTTASHSVKRHEAGKTII